MNGRGGPSDAHHQPHPRTHRSPTTEFWRRRELVAGSRWWLSTDPELAAAQLVAKAGGRERAKGWAEALLGAIELWRR